MSPALNDGQNDNAADKTYYLQPLKIGLTLCPCRHRSNPPDPPFTLHTGRQKWAMNRAVTGASGQPAIPQSPVGWSGFQQYRVTIS